MGCKVKKLKSLKLEQYVKSLLYRDMDIVKEQASHTTDKK